MLDPTDSHRPSAISPVAAIFKSHPSHNMKTSLVWIGFYITGFLPPANTLALTVSDKVSFQIQNSNREYLFRKPVNPFQSSKRNQESNQIMTSVQDCCIGWETIEQARRARDIFANVL